MTRIVKFGYDVSSIHQNLGRGDIINTKVMKGFKTLSFKSVGGALKYACKAIGTSYRKNDWCLEHDLDDKHNDGWVLHVIVEKGTMKYATPKMIEEWKKDRIELVDLLVNVFVESN